ncbi:MAG TPA: nuclear transport factor 2 family protein [Pseudomonadales bacterium]
MSESNKTILERANAAILAEDHEGFLECCTDDTHWIFVGERTLRGKDAVRQWLAETYPTPPRFNVSTYISEGDNLAAIGEITVTDKQGKSTSYSYCDVWRLRNGKLAELRAYVVETSA